ncbi:hypothetical protein [Paludisphaera mucosa]|uniref:Uncharacterized protein n=1 Tax=Paludisphaera mucosa TaxID=3030827 RepID=A0ABT6FA32_9BACT|nr:hypothetical protein [Paludisphaera mucosa]MDG3004294.1 hypothetical protein [Paludisphaera mucosa]
MGDKQVDAAGIPHGQARDVSAAAELGGHEASSGRAGEAGDQTGRLLKRHGIVSGEDVLIHS